MNSSVAGVIRAQVLHGLFSVSAILLPALTYADAPSVENAREVIVNVRVIHACDEPVNKTTVRSQAGKIEHDLRDIGMKLSELHYRNFKLVCKQEEEIPLMKKRTVYLNDGNTLTVRPLYAEGDKVGLWLRWLDGNGVRILDTRMHFHAGETMLTGTDIFKDAGIILAIDVRPVQ